MGITFRVTRKGALEEDGTQRPRRHSAIKSPPRRAQVRKMIRIALSDAAYDAISSTLPKGSARWPMQRDRGQGFIQVESAIVDRMRAMRRPGESYSSVILRLVELRPREPEETASDSVRDCCERDAD